MDRARWQSACVAVGGLVGAPARLLVARLAHGLKNQLAGRWADFRAPGVPDFVRPGSGSFTAPARPTTRLRLRCRARRGLPGGGEMDERQVVPHWLGAGDALPPVVGVPALAQAGAPMCHGHGSPSG